MTRPRQTLRSALAVGLVAAAAGLGLSGCDHVTDVDGPLLTDRFGDFNVLDPLAASASSADFAAGEAVVFTARFNKQTNWVLEITGEQSGAVKRIEGFSNELNASNATWRGGTTELPLFKPEPVSAALFFPDETSVTDTLRADVAVLSAREYPGTVVAAFEGADNLTIGNFEFELEGAGISAEVPPGQGDGFLLFRGTDDVVPNFFVGLVDLRPPGGGVFPVPTSVPEDLFLNFFLYGFNTPNTIAVVQVIADANGNGAFDDGTDTVFPFGDVRPDFVGWRAFAKPLGELGLTQAQAQNIVAVRVLLISDLNNQPSPPLPVDFGIDYITLTAGGPLEL